MCRWEDKFKNLGTIDDLKQKVKALKHEMAWAFVVEKEKVRQLALSSFAVILSSIVVFL